MEFVDSDKDGFLSFDEYKGNLFESVRNPHIGFRALQM